MNVELSELVGIVGGWSVILAGLSGWLGKVLSGRILQKENASYSKEIEILKSSLDLERSKEIRKSDAQFNLYSEVWSSLMDVKSVGDELWENASKDNISNFIKALKKAKAAINRGRLILKEEHYQRLRELLGDFSSYEIGKLRLYELRTNDQLDEALHFLTEEEIRRQISHNRECKKNYEAVLDEIVVIFRTQLGITA